ncbi:TPA: hypothetical protein EYN23_04840, partial [Candidatus Poribacteria bacterium]|nr:hypothetical protein [Candidatus Poribacteria bacterium]
MATAVQTPASEFTPINGSYYTFEISLSPSIYINLLPGWNLISLPGQPLEPDPQSLVGDSETAMLPMFRWNPTGFSYQEVTELKFGEGYWILSLNPDGETLHVPVSPVT